MDYDHQVYGDWRDLRGAIERSCPDWNQLSDESRSQMWTFAQAVLGEYSPLNFRCIGCKEVHPLAQSYRCADCHAPLCKTCIRPHFGPNHRSHS